MKFNIIYVPVVQRKRNFQPPLTEKQLWEELEKGLSDIEYLVDSEDEDIEGESIVIQRRVGDPLPDPAEYVDNDVQGDADGSDSANNGDDENVDSDLNEDNVKCDVHLCLNNNNNCFITFHT